MESPVLDIARGTRHDLNRPLLDGISARLGTALVLCDADDRITWTSAVVEKEFPGLFCAGRPFRGLPDAGDAPTETTTPGEMRYFDPRSGRAACYRHLHFAVPDANGGGGMQVHCFVNITGEKSREASFLESQHQLTSMKEIIDILYESISTQEVLYMILVAVTAQMGFGFNRALYLEARGERLKGKIAIGPSNADDAHRIWARLSQLNLPTLRAIYDDLTRHGEPPDPQSQEVTSRMDFRIRPTTEGLLGAIERRKPALIHRDEPGTEVDAQLFEMLGSDAIAVVPLFVREKLAGVLIADNFVTRQPITDHDLSVLKTFSGYAGVALERSQLYDELREKVAETQAANDRMKRHQQKLLQAEKLSAIGELAACVSHEIRNPMVAIGGLARSLMRDESLGEKNRESLQMIASEVARLEKFLRETLDFVKPEVMGAELLDVRLETERGLAPLRGAVAERDIELELDLPDEPVICKVDPDFLRRAVSNLVQNSIEALERGGRISVTIKKEEHAARIVIADSGPGIPPELRARIFEPFYTTKAQGTGLGLAIASQGIRSLGGTITLASNSLQDGGACGTIFNITLPCRESSDADGGGEAERTRR